MESFAVMTNGFYPRTIIKLSTYLLELNFRETFFLELSEIGL